MRKRKKARPKEISLDRIKNLKNSVFRCPVCGPGPAWQTNPDGFDRTPSRLPFTRLTPGQLVGQVPNGEPVDRLRRQVWSNAQKEVRTEGGLARLGLDGFESASLAL